MAAEEERGLRQASNWVDVQKKTFTNWINDRLKETDRRVEDLETDLEDGVTLIKLLEVLAPGKKMPGRHFSNPRTLIQRNENLAIAWKFMHQTENIPLVNIGPGDITGHNQKLILGLVWALILHYQITTPTETKTEGKEKDSKTKREKQTAKKVLLGWVATALPNKGISNFSSDWNDGINLSALVNYCKPGLIPNHASLDSKNALQNIMNAMNLAEENLDIPQVMQPKDLAVEKPDERSVMTYISYFRHLSVGQNSRPGTISTEASGPIAAQIHDKGEVTLKLLDLELQEVSEWFRLGLYLDIPSPKLYDIKHDSALHCAQDKRTEMLSVWTRLLPGPSWSCVVKALMDVGRETLAHRIADKYGVAVPAPASVEKKLPEVDTSSQATMPLQTELSTQVENLTKELKAKDRELAVKEKSLEEARRQKDEEKQRVAEIKQTIRQAQEKNEKLIEEKMEIEKQLQLKEKELDSLSTAHERDDEQLQNKKEKIKKLKQRLQEIQSELSSEKKRSQKLRDKLQKAKAELEKKSALEREQEKASEVLRITLEKERQRVDLLMMQLMSANASRDQYAREVEHQISTARVERERNAKEINQHKLTISQKEEDIETLSQQLHEQEALIAKLEQEAAVAAVAGAKQERELFQRILKMTDKADELRDKLEEAREGREGAVRELEAAQLESKLLQTQMKELRQQQAKVEEDRGRLLREMEAKDILLQQKHTHLEQKDIQLQEKDDQLQDKDDQLQEKATQISRQQRELQTLTEDRGQLQSEVETKLAQVQEKDAEISRQQKELLKLREDRQRLQTEVETKDNQLQQKDGQIQQQGAELQEKATQISRQQRELQTLREDREKLQTEVEAKLSQVQEKDAEISRQQRELQTLKAAKTPKVQAANQLNSANLSFELTAVIDWFSLGVNLNLEKHELVKIERDHDRQGNDRQRLEMLDKWLRCTPCATWGDVVRALEQMGENRVAENIRRKYIREGNTGTPSATSSRTQNPPTVTVAIAKWSIQNIHGRFAILLTESRKRLQIRGIDVEEVQDFLIIMYSSPESRDGSDTVTTVLESARSLKEIFRALSKHRLWDYLNYCLLQSIIEAFASDDNELKGMMEKYQKNLMDHILSQEIATYLDAISDGENSADETPNPELFKMLTTKCDANVTEHTLSYVNDLRQSLSDQLALPPTALILHKISKGCINITWRIPANLDKHVTKTAQETSSKFATDRIMKVMLEEQSIYCEPLLQSIEDQLTSEKGISEELKEKKMEVEKQLQLKEEELESLRTVHQKDSEQLQNKEEEIRVFQEDRGRLQGELEAKDVLLQQKDDQLQQKATQISRQQRELQTLREDREKLQGEVEAKLAQVQEKDAEISRQQRELQTLMEDKGRLQAEVEAKDTQLQQKDGQIERQGAEIKEKATQISRQQRELQTLKEDREKLQTEVESKLAHVQEKDVEISRQQRELQTLREDKGKLQADVEAKDSQLKQKDGQIEQQDTELQEKATQISRQQRELQTLRDDREKLQAEGEAKLAQVQEKDAEISRQQRELQTLREDKGKLQAEVKTKDTQLQQKDAQIQQHGAELQEKATQISRQQRELQTLTEDRGQLQSEVETKLAQVQEKDAEISRQQKELLKLREDRQRLQTEMEAKNTQLQQKDAQIQQQGAELQEKATQISRQQRELQTLTEDMEKLQAEVEAKLAQVQRKDAEISRQQRELQTLREDKGRLQAEVKAKDTQLQQKDGQIQRQGTELQEKATQISRQHRELQTLKVPSPPGKPTASDDDIIHNSILLKWAKPHQGGDYVKHYSISYRRRYDPPHQWQTRLSDGAQTTLTVSGLDPKTEYCFKVHAVSDYGISKDSEVSTFRTKVRLAEEMLSSAKLIEAGPPAIYQLKAQDVVVHKSNQLKMLLSTKAINSEGKTRSH